MSEKEINPVAEIIYNFSRKRFRGNVENKVQRWLIDDNKTAEKEEALYSEFDSINLQADESVYSSLDAVNRKIDIITKMPKKKIPIYRNFLRIAAILIPLMMLAGGYYILNKDLNTQNIDWAEVSVPYGEQEYITLPDGTQVWVNAGSSVKYSQDITNDERIVELTGEAFFSVAKDSLRPFVVHINDISIRVYGTEFNVKGYSDHDNVEIALNSGKVSVETALDKAISLMPGQQLIYSKVTSETQVSSKAAIEDASAWKQGEIVFEDVTFKDILSTLERHYNVSFDIKNFVLTGEQYSVKIEKNDNLQRSMEILELLVTGFSYKIENDKRVTITKENINKRTK